MLALLTRVRAVRVAQGVLAPGRLHDLRAFKTAWAELAYLRRLAASGRYGGTVVTSMRQLVAGLAALHPAWRITGEGFEDRDRHHRAVRRRLRDLQAMGLLHWRVGVDEDDQERRTELELCDVPELTAQELAAADAQLTRWQQRYGAGLDTGSTTEILDVRRASRPLSAAERQRRGCHHARRRAAARRRRVPSQSNSAPPFGAVATPQNNLSTNQNASEIRNASQRTGVTRASASTAIDVALDQSTETAAIEKDKTSGRGAAEWDIQALLDRVAARQAERAPVLELIGNQAAQRALELVGWDLDRAWPPGRVREAWVVTRYGQDTAAESGASAAGTLDDEDYARLRRAVARYQRNRFARPDGFPETGLGALLHLGGLAAQRGGPRTVRYAIGALDQLSRRMRAHASADNVTRTSAAQRRAQNRRLGPPPNTRLQFRLSGPRWPRWLRVDEHGMPVFAAGLPVIDSALAPSVGSEAYRTVIRDAYLIADRPLPTLLDGRWAMHLRDTGQIPPAERRDRGAVDHQLAELAHRTGQPQSTWTHVGANVRAGVLAHLRATEAHQARAQTQAFQEQISQAIRPGSA